MVTIDQVAACPKCHKMRALVKSERRRSPDDGQVWDVAVYMCDNTECSDHLGVQIIQSDMRGNVFERPRGRDGKLPDHMKTFPKLSPDMMATGRRAIEEVQRALDDEEDQE